MDLESVLPFYLFTDTFNSIGWCKRRGIEKNRFFFKKNVRSLQKMCRDKKRCFLFRKQRFMQINYSVIKILTILFPGI